MHFRPLEPDELVGVAALSGPVDLRKLDDGIEVLRSWGHEVVLGANVHDRREYLAGNDEARIAGLVELLDRGIRCILAARGGYGVTRLLDSMPWRRLLENEVSFVGYSDLTAVMNPLVTMGGAVQLHGPVVTELGEKRDSAQRLRMLLDGCVGDGLLFEFASEAVVRSGQASGRAMGGNLSLLAALSGTAFSPNLSGAALFLEDVNEPAYRLDRLLTQLRYSGTFNEVKAFVSGNLHCCDMGSAGRWRELLLEAAPAGIPIVDGLSFGHGDESRPFPIGAEVTIDTKAGTVRWRT